MVTLFPQLTLHLNEIRGKFKWGTSRVGVFESSSFELELTGPSTIIFIFLSPFTDLIHRLPAFLVLFAKLAS